MKLSLARSQITFATQATREAIEKEELVKLLRELIVFPVPAL